MSTELRVQSAQFAQDTTALSDSSAPSDSLDLSDSSELISITKGELDSLYQRALLLSRVVAHFYETVMAIKSRTRRINTARRRAIRLSAKR